MSEVKDRHTCKECRHFDKQENCCGKTFWDCEIVDPDLEACSDFEPRGGWQE